MTAINYEGAMLGGYLLPHDSFVKIMTQMLDQSSDKFIQRIDDIHNCVIKKQFKTAFNHWENFEANLLLNPRTQLMTIGYYQDEQNNIDTQILTYTKEKQSVNQKGNIDYNQLIAMRSALQNTYKSSYFLDHYKDLLFCLQDSISYEEETFFWNKYGKIKDSRMSGVKTRLNQAKNNKNYTYLEIVYGSNTGSSQREGKIYDAFVNHLGALHNSLFKKGKDSVVTIDDSTQFFDHSVKYEEDANTTYGFLKLLLASLNSTAWYTGGDLILTDPNGLILLSLQVKTHNFASASGTIGRVSSEGLDKELQKIKKSFDTENNQQIAERYYQLLKTSGMTEAVYSHIQQSAEQLAASALNKALNINIVV